MAKQLTYSVEYTPKGHSKRSYPRYKFAYVLAKSFTDAAAKFEKAKRGIKIIRISQSTDLEVII